MKTITTLICCLGLTLTVHAERNNARLSWSDQLLQILEIDFNPVSPLPMDTFKEGDDGGECEDDTGGGRQPAPIGPIPEGEEEGTGGIC